MKQNKSAEFKCKVALEALKEDRPLNEIAKEYKIHPLQVGKWKKQLIEQGKKRKSKYRRSFGKKSRPIDDGS